MNSKASTEKNSKAMNIPNTSQKRKGKKRERESERHQQWQNEWENTENDEICSIVNWNLKEKLYLDGFCCSSHFIFFSFCCAQLSDHTGSIVCRLLSFLPILSLSLPLSPFRTLVWLIWLLKKINRILFLFNAHVFDFNKLRLNKFDAVIETEQKFQSENSLKCLLKIKFTRDYC